ncbi:MAG TPA: hypothetical protein QF764_13195 [Planctomycetota bacterium]|jgi:hypothetical protein|nr:hypothetical protein [Planctomycetota bacterium]
MILSLIALAIASVHQGDAAPELTVPDRHVHLAVAPEGRHLMVLDQVHAWLVDTDTGEPRLGLRVSPYFPAGDNWNGAQFSEDGLRVALWSFRGARVLVDAERGQVLRRTERPNDHGHQPAFASPDARLTAARQGDLLTVHDLDGERTVFSERVAGEACFSSDGRRLYLCGPEAVERVDLARPERREVLAAGRWDELALAGERLLLGRGDRVQVVDPETGEMHGLDLDENDWRLGGVSDDGEIAVLFGGKSRVLGLALPGLTRAWQVEGWYANLIPRAGVVWMTNTQHHKSVHDEKTGELLWTLNTEVLRPPSRPPSVLDGALLLPTRRGGLARVDPRTGEVLTLLPAPLRRVKHAGVLACGAVWTLNVHGGLVVLDAQHGAVLARRELGAPFAQATSAMDRMVVVDKQGSAHVFEGASLTALCDVGGVGEAQLSADGERLVVFGGAIDGARLLDAANGAVLRSVGAGNGTLRRVAVARGGTLLAALDSNREPLLWRDEVAVTLPDAAADVRSLALDPRGRWLALGTNPPLVQVFDVASGALVTVFEPTGWFPFGGDVRTLAFDHAGERLIGTTGDAGMVQIWRTDDWGLDWVHDFDGGNPSSLVTTLDPTGKILWVHGMTNHTQRAFDLSSGRVLHDAAGSDLGGFAPGAEVVAALRRNGLVLLEPDGSVRLERMDLGPLGAVTLRGRALDGPPAALRRVFVRLGEELLRGDDYAKRESTRER